MLSIQLNDSLLEFLYDIGFIGSSTIDGINYGITEFIQFSYDLSDDSLVREVLFSCQHNDSLDEDCM